MFRDTSDEWPFGPGHGPKPAPKRPNLSPADRRMLGRVLGLNAVLLMIAPIGGATLIHPLIAWLTGP